MLNDYLRKFFFLTLVLNSTVKLSNLMRTRISIRKVRLNEIEFLIFFQIFMIPFGRIELAICRIKH